MPGPDTRHYTSARWNVRPESEDDFVKTWTRLVTWTLKSKFAMEEAILLQEADDSSRFMSVLTWKGLDEIAGWRKSADYRKYISKLQEFCSEIQIRTLRPVAHVKKR